MKIHEYQAKECSEKVRGKCGIERSSHFQLEEELSADIVVIFMGQFKAQNSCWCACGRDSKKGPKFACDV